MPQIHLHWRFYCHIYSWVPVICLSISTPQVWLDSVCKVKNTLNHSILQGFLTNKATSVQVTWKIYNFFEILLLVCTHQRQPHCIFPTVTYISFYIYWFVYAYICVKYCLRGWCVLSHAAIRRLTAIYGYFIVLLFT